MDVDHPSPHSRMALPPRPLKASRNEKRHAADSIQMSAHPASVEHTNALDPINDSKGPEVRSEQRSSSTAMLDHIEIRRNWEEDFLNKRITGVESTPLQRWLDEDHQHQSWNTVAILKPVYDLTNAQNDTTEDNVDSLNSCNATHTPSVTGGFLEALSEVHGSVLKSSAAEKDLEFKGMGAGILGATGLDVSILSQKF